MEDPSSGNDRAMNVELPGSDHDEEREDRSRSDRSASPTAGSVFQGRFQDRGRPRSQETVAMDESWTYGRPTGPARGAYGCPGRGEGRCGHRLDGRIPAQRSGPPKTSDVEGIDQGGTPYVYGRVQLVHQPDNGPYRQWDTLKKRIKAAVVIDMSVQDADSRIGKMLDGLAAAIRRDCQEWVIKEESPAIVKIITDAVKSVSLHRAVTEQMALKRNKPLKKDRFVRWLREYAIGHERFVGYEEDTKPAAKPDPPKTNQGGTHGLRTAPTRSTPRAPATATTPQAPPGLTSANGCLKCKSTSHRVRKCPGITEEEAVKLLKAHGRALGRGRSDGDRGRRDGGRGNGHRMATMKTDPVHTERAKLVATVEGVLTVNASLLDSGADLSVASGGLVSALLAAGAAPEITTMGPFSLRPYGADSRPVVVTKQVRFGSLEFKTGCGPLMLRGLRVWVDEAVAGVELTLGLPVMQKLGYSDKTLLENARRQQAEWDFADQSIATPGEAMHRTLRMEETLVDDIDDDEGMCCATPDWGTDPYPTDDGQVDDDPVLGSDEASRPATPQAGPSQTAEEVPE
ncbi:hypothetical protein DYB28_006994 [Aphanomyces astaci]|uniref:Peptidase A2 domain-containing protein n=1 Tax=Aphanomyces astaci TaxID=112090 RepID=A0A9X8H982_APHAT|nr:hypothetical protein DYB28_006994 [Aphanomyces astaci]